MVSSGRRVSTLCPGSFSRKPTDRSCARRFAGDWTADGMSCPLRREHLIIRSQVFAGRCVGCPASVKECCGCCCSSGTTGPKITTTSRSRTRRAGGWRRPACRKGLEGITRLHALVAEHAPADWAELAAEEVAGRVVIGIETDRGPWVTALRAAGYQVYAINPMSAARYRERHSHLGCQDRRRRCHVLAEIVRLDREHHRQIAGDTDLGGEAGGPGASDRDLGADPPGAAAEIHIARILPGSAEAFEDLAARTLLLLARAPSPARAAKLTRSQVVSALRAARRHHVEAKADALLTALRAPGLRQPATVRPHTRPSSWARSASSPR